MSRDVGWGVGLLTLALVVLIAGLAAACNDSRPGPAPEPALLASLNVANVRVVYASRERQPPILMPGDYDPLWGDLDADTPIIEKLLLAIAGGTPVNIEEVVGDSYREIKTVNTGWGVEEVLIDGPTWASKRSLAINIGFRDGSIWSVRQLRKCDFTPEGNPTNCLPVPDHWELVHRDEVVESRALTQWFERVEEYMPKAKFYEVPDPMNLGEPYTISGAGYHEGERVELSIKFSDESEMHLGELPLDHGAFRWDGEIPETALSGLANVTMRVLEGTEVLWSTTRSSVTVIKDIEVVYASRRPQPPFLAPGSYDPLWGGLDADAPVIDRLLRAIADGTVDRVGEEEGIAYSDRGLVVNVRFRDGTTWSVKQVRKCNLSPEGLIMNCVFVPDHYHWDLLLPNEVASSWLLTERALTKWFERVEEYMPRVEDYFKFPELITLGETFTISGAGYYEGERVELSIELSDEGARHLGELPLEHGAFRWDGEIPETAPSGPAKVTMRVLEGTEVVWSTIQSTTAVVPNEALQSFGNAQTQPDWRKVEVPGWPSQRGFSLRMPPGWELNELRGIDSYVGEVVGDGVRLVFDYGGFSWGLDPPDDQEHNYVVAYQNIGGVAAKLLIPIDASSGYIGVYFNKLSSSSLNLVGKDLTTEQQQTAMAIFRSIRFLGQ